MNKKELIKALDDVHDDAEIFISNYGELMMLESVACPVYVDSVDHHIWASTPEKDDPNASAIMY